MFYDKQCLYISTILIIYINILAIQIPFKLFAVFKQEQSRFINYTIPYISYKFFQHMQGSSKELPIVRDCQECLDIIQPLLHLTNQNNTLNTNQKEVTNIAEKSYQKVYFAQGESQFDDLPYDSEQQRQNEDQKNNENYSHSKEDIQQSEQNAPQQKKNKLQRRNNSTQQYSCMKCHKKYDIRKSYYNHLRSHELQYKCQYDNCGKKFSIQSAKERHARIHTGQKPYQCDYDKCQQKFNQKSNLNRHKKIHKKQKPFICGTCCKKFTTTTNLKQHKQTHLQNKQERKVFNCQVEGCDKKYFYACNLKKHAKEHFDPMGECLQQQGYSSQNFSFLVGGSKIKISYGQQKICTQSMITYTETPGSVLYNPQQFHLKQRFQDNEHENAETTLTNHIEQRIKQLLGKVNNTISVGIILHKGIAYLPFIRAIIGYIGFTGFKIINIILDDYEHFINAVSTIIRQIPPSEQKMVKEECDIDCQ